MIISYKIIPFPKYVLRTPLFPLSLYLDLLENYSLEKAIKIYRMPLITEALSLASPELLTELNRWSKKDSNLSDQKREKLEITFLKYLARMSSRCTPFGLFAGCSLGTISKETKIILETSEKFKRVTQFDMQFWVALLQEIANRENVIPYLKYYPNSSIYKIGDFYRYVEYKYLETKREHSIIALKKSDPLTTLLFHTKSGITLDEMILLLAYNETEKTEARKFIMQLISFQFLVSDLDGVVTGNNEWERVLSILSTIPNLKKEYKFLKTVQKQLSELDKELIPSKGKYNQIKKEIEKIGFPFNEKYLFQTDLNTITSHNSLNSTISGKVLQALHFLNGIQSKKESENLENFRKAFYRRYESRSMPLTTVLDTEIGIGYLQDEEMNDSHEILEYLSLSSKKEKNINQQWSSYDFILHKKLKECILNRDKTITLAEKDFVDFDPDLSLVPVTFSVMIEVFDNDKIVIESSGDVSAAKLLGRFCIGNPEIHDLTKEIIEKETEYHSNKIMAEIVHIPEARTGNILRRPILRQYEIAYLANSEISKKNNIDLTDLWISVADDRIILRSKKHNKEVIPCLSNAHIRYLSIIFYAICKDKTINQYIILIGEI